jgi:hypothetical protein
MSDEAFRLMSERGHIEKLLSSREQWLGFKINILSYFATMLRIKLKVRKDLYQRVSLHGSINLSFTHKPF